MEMQAGPPEMRYQIAGEGRTLFTRTEIRDRIRSGEMRRETELVREGSDEYRPASEFPELERYFSLVSGAPAAATPGGWVGATPAAPREPVSPVFARALPALVFPFTGFGWIVILLAAVLEIIPVVGIVVGMFVAVYAIAVIRASSEGATRMPGPAAIGGAGEALLTLLKLIAIGLICLWPVILGVLAMFVLPRAAGSLTIAILILVALYYPACLAMLAKYRSIRPALSVSQTFAFMGVLGSDYVVALLSMAVVVGVCVPVVLLVAAERLDANLGGLALGVLTTWGTFYVFHLIGWAMWRHRDELP